MDRRFLTVLGVSLLFALVVSSIFYQLTARAGGAPKKDKVEMREVVVAARPLPMGASIKPADVKIEKTAASQFPKGAFSRVEEVIDRPVVSNVLLDEPVLDGRLGVRGSGAGLAPMDCFLVSRGIKTLAVRMKQHDANGRAIARFLEDHPCVKHVLYPGLPSHPQHDVAVRQQRGLFVDREMPTISGPGDPQVGNGSQVEDGHQAQGHQREAAAADDDQQPGPDLEVFQKIHRPPPLAIQVASWSFSRISTRRILPLIVLGRTVTNSMIRGYLYGAVTFLTCSCSSSFRASPGW